MERTADLAHLVAEFLTHLHAATQRGRPLGVRRSVLLALDEERDAQAFGQRIEIVERISSAEKAA